jgi:hypothetical protein
LAVESKVKSNDVQVVLSEVKSKLETLNVVSVGQGSAELRGDVDEMVVSGRQGNSRFEVKGHVDEMSGRQGSSRFELNGHVDEGASHARVTIIGGATIIGGVAIIGGVEEKWRSVGNGSRRCRLIGNVDTPVSIGNGSSGFELDGNVDTTEAFGSNGDGSSRHELNGNGDPEKMMETILSKISLGWTPPSPCSKGES